MSTTDFRSRYCVVGAGAAGLAVAKNFSEHSIAFDVFDRHDDVGGLWGYGRPYSAVYGSARLISSKTMTQYRGFPMSAELPDYPGHEPVFRYLKSYADAFKLRDHINFNTEIRQISRVGEYWAVELGSGETRTYGGLVLASGVTWDPNYPALPGSFAGQSLHSFDYKTPEFTAGKRVLVVGGGNSGCDIAADIGSHADRCFFSVRRGYHFIPRYVLGLPSDRFGEFSIKMGTPIWLRQWMNQIIVRLLLGDPVKLGLPKPDHRIFESHPIVNAEVLGEIRAGRVSAKADVKELRGDTVVFTDGSEEKIDVIIYATGYKISFPYLDGGHLNAENGTPKLYLNAFHPSYDNLFVVGMIQPDSGVWGLMDDQARLIAAYIQALGNNTDAARHFKQLKTGAQPDLSGGIKYLDSARHDTEVEHASYRKIVEQHINSLAA